MWHMYPVVKIIITTLDLYIFDGLPSPEDMRMKDDGRRPMLLSTFLIRGNESNTKKE